MAMNVMRDSRYEKEAEESDFGEALIQERSSARGRRKITRRLVPSRV